MTWRVELKETARRELRKLDPPIQGRIRRFLRERIATEHSPRRIGKTLKGPLSEFWRYYVGDYRLLCHIEDDVRLVQVVAIGHRSDVYR